MSKFEDQGLRRGGHRAPGEALRDFVDRVVAAIGFVVKQCGVLGARRGRKSDRVLSGRVTKPRFGFNLLGHKLRVVHENIDLARELYRCRVVLAPAIRARTENAWVVVGHVRERGVAVTDPKSERSSTFVRNLKGFHLEPLDVELAFVDRSKRPFSAEFVWSHGKVRRRHPAGDDFDG